MNEQSPHSPQSRVIFSAARIAELMAEDRASAVLPTPEQTRVIEQPLGRSVLVIAGAGSGKTETMANRVVWLVANGFAIPSQILGLTFTRKAAGELGERVVERLQRFSERLGSAEVFEQLGADERRRATELRELMDDGLDLPEISTYNAFASAVVQEFGAIAGVAAGGTVIDEATAWGIAREIVCSSDEAALIESSDSISVIVKQVMNLDHAVADNLTSFDEVIAKTETLDALAELPYNEKKREGRYAAIDRVLENMTATRLAVRLARRFSDEKRRRGLIEFSDQLALAVETLRRSPEAVRVLRQRTPIVLLDEVQDTSVGQSTLLSLLFCGCSVMAVGDPHQSIYGFRGASASNLQSFHRDFGGRSTGRAEAPVTLSLSTSWRNPGVVLEAANTVSAPLAARLEAETTGLAVKPLTSKAAYLGVPEATDVRSLALEVSATETLAEEFSSLAEWMRSARNEHLARTGEPPTAAVVFRSRRHMPAVSEALWAVGVPNRIVGLGGLLSTPEVTDLVCALRCIWFADAGNELLRLLAGPRFRLGVADLAGLQQAAKWFSGRDHAKQPLTEAERDAMSAMTDPERSFTLLDALDELATMPNLDHSALRAITDIGKVRLRDAGQMFRSLRREVGSDVLALLRTVTQELRLDIELDAGEHNGYDGSAVARANLDAFTELVEGFLATDEQGTLASVLHWLEKASENDEAAEHVPEPEPGTVQLITVHGSKGLEWQLVAIPRMVDGEFPASAREGMGWLRPGQLPDELRGDANARPKLELALADTQKNVTEAISAYQQALQNRHADEERRLAYVAITRAASRLLLSCSFWGGQTKARPPAVYLQELERAGLIGPLPTESAFDSDPSAGEARTLEWPTDPLGRRAPEVRFAAETLRSALSKAAERGASVEQAALHPVVVLLLAEQDAERQTKRQTGREYGDGVGVDTAPPSADRLTASTFHEFVEHPVEAERRRLRPLPVRPYRKTRTGNLFHEWVERRSSTPRGSALTLAGIDFDAVESEGSGEALPGVVRAEPHEDLQVLIEQFERSRWADRQPIEVELEITLPFAGRTLVCKLDAVYRQNGQDRREGRDGREDRDGEENRSDSAEAPEAPERYEIVDWKSGRPPKNEKERASRFLQLDLYRHAYASWAGIEPSRIDVSLFYVAEGVELKSEQPRTLEELEALWRNAECSLAR